MATVSLCMIVKNEEKVLGRCLDSAKEIADEIIIVDTGSTDRTKEIAAEYTEKIYDFKSIFPQRETNHSERQRRITVCGWTRMT